MSTSALGLRAWARLVILCAVALAPPAQAIAASGELLAEGPWQVVGPALTQVQPAGVYLAEAPGLASFSLTAASVEVIQLRRVSAQAQVVDVAPRVEDRSYEVTLVSLSLLATPEGGWLGIYPESASATLESSMLVGESSAPAAYGNGRATPEVAPDPQVRAYSVDAREPHVLLESAGKLVITGDFALKFEGPDLAVLAAENSTQIETGYTPPRLGAGIAENRWAFLRVTEGRLELVSESPFALPAPEAEIDWNGILRLAPRSGGIEAAGTSYLSDGRAATLEGTFTGRFLARGDSTDTTMLLEGDLESTTLGRVSAPADTGRGASGWLLVGAVATVVAAGVATYAVVGRRRAAPLFSTDEYVRLAAEAAEAEDYDAALGWTRKARVGAPTSARLATDEGFFLERLGETGPALAAYARAMALSDDGEPEFLAFLLASRLDLEEEAARCLIAALDKSPSLVLGLEPRQLATVAHRADVAQKIAWAERQLPP